MQAPNEFELILLRTDTKNKARDVIARLIEYARAEALDCDEMLCAELLGAAQHALVVESDHNLADWAGEPQRLTS